MQTVSAPLPMRSDFFLIPDNYKDVRSTLVTRFGELLRKIWNTRNFKGQVRHGWLVGRVDGVEWMVWVVWVAYLCFACFAGCAELGVCLQARCFAEYGGCSCSVLL